MEKIRKTQVTVVVADDYLDKLEHVAKSLRRMGMHRTQLLKSSGAIIGEVDLQNREKLLAIPGVLDVEESQESRLPPPDSEIQ